MTSNNNKELLKKAFIAAMYEKYNEELSVCNETALCSSEHRKRIRKIISGHAAITPRKCCKKKTALALLIAAALLLAGCTAYVYRKQIGNFFAEVFDKYIVGVFDNGEEENILEITDVYTVACIPEGYTLQKETVRSNRVTYTWQNEAEEIISFDQRIYDKTLYYIDNEKGETDSFQCNEYTIYSASSELSQIYLWDNGKYVFTLRTTYELPQEEIIKIIESVGVKQ